MKDKDKNVIKETLKQPDRSGLLPIHWMAMNNRADLMEVICKYDDASCLRRQCKNRMLSNGTPLHLAAMNGSLEVAAFILTRYSKQAGEKDRCEPLKDRDSQGQTPLMRAAAPKSRRINLFFDLMRKNFWSLNSRPAEMALYLIGWGADWRETEPRQGLNLIHLAIINGHEDIVNLLLVIDLQLTEVAIKFDEKGDGTQTRVANEEVKHRVNDEDDSEQEPLLDKKSDIVQHVMTNGLRPLDLAIVYRRVNLINLLWLVSSKASREASQKKGDDLKLTLIKACFTNKDELFRFLKPLLFRTALFLDFSLYIFSWIPLSLHHNSVDRFVFSMFFILTSLTVALTFRAMMKDPGYLGRNSVQYLNEVSRILALRNEKRKSKQEPKQEDDKPLDLIKTEGKEMIVKKQEDPGSSEGGARKEIENARLTRIHMPETVESSYSGKPGQDELVGRVRMLCHKCRCVRRARSRHCDYCNRCILDFDHHCIYLASCVGRYNRLDFLVAMLFVTFSSLFGVIIYLDFRKSVLGSFWGLVGLVWILKYVIIGGLSSYKIARRACQGITMYEEIRAKRIRNTFGDGAAERLRNQKYWRYPDGPPQFGSSSKMKESLANLYEFANSMTVDEYVLELVSSDTPLTQSLVDRNAKINLYKFV